MRKLLTGAIRLYQIAMSPFMQPCCRFIPSCSEYAAQAIERHGTILGSWAALKRVSRCHPWARGGYDPA